MNKLNFKKINKLIFWIIGLIYLISLTFQFNDTDLYYILHTGNYLMDNIHNETVFPNLFTPLSIVKNTCIIQNWLYCIILAFINNYLHTFGLWIIQTIFLCLCVFVILKFLNFKHCKNKLVCFYISLFTLFVFQYTSLRPEMLTFILIMSEILIIEKYRKTNNCKILWILPLLMLIEINCHASYWIIHFIVLIPYLIIIPKKFQKNINVTIINNNIKLSQIKAMILPLILMTAVMFLNPYKTEAILYIYNALISKATEVFPINELNSWSINSIFGLIIIISIISFLYMILKGKIKSSSLWMFIGFTILAITKMKWIAFYSIGLLFLLRDIFIAYENKQRMFGRKNDTSYSILSKILLIGLLISLIFYIGLTTYQMYQEDMFSITNDNYMINDNNDVFNSNGDFTKMKNYLKKHEDNAYIYGTFQEGNYFEYLGYETNLDARPELYINTSINNYKNKSIKSKVKTPPLYEAYELYYYKKYNNYDDKNTILSAKEYSKLVDSIDTDYFVVESISYLQQYLETASDKYEYITGGDNYKLYKKL